jgi:hypothetical protein
MREVVARARDLPKRKQFRTGEAQKAFVNKSFCNVKALH